MATFPFLRDEWVSEARKIREEYEGKGAVVPHQMKMNLNVTEVPFGTGALDAHLDTSDGAAKLELGHIEPVDLTVTVDYATAKARLPTPRRPRWPTVCAPSPNSNPGRARAIRDYDDEAPPPLE